ncbi:MAG: glycosyl hydrolase [Clostridia bacterium]|nr:glycosyl hydrolase [Clostridia bacterium]NLS86323.1 glycosyl hydrolase [Oscillospiraceae bacterium]
MNIKNKAKEIVSQLTFEKKASLCSGRDFWHAKGLERFDIKPIMLTDGPHGLRKQAGSGDHLGINDSVPATCFPPACTTASSFDRELLKEIGNALGEECLQEDVAVLLGPGTNIKRSPLCGRNFEYISEDPLLAGELAAAIISGVQEKGVGTSMKHFAANNQEKSRMTSDSVIDERTLREIYLTAFETAVKKSQPWTLMCSYNKLNGTYACENYKLLTGILRDEWGFNGLVMTDWGAMNDRVEAIKAGLDLEMPASDGINDAKIVKAVKEGSLDEKAVDICVERVVKMLLNAQQSRREGYRYDAKAHHELARKAAAQSAVLLKNDDKILPASPKNSIAVIGAFAKTPRYQGAGSSKINSLNLDCALDEINKYADSVTYADGYSLQSAEPDDELIKEACEAANGKDIVFLFAGLPDSSESEGFDRETLAMPESHNKLIEAVSAVNPNLVVILQCGAPVTMPWLGGVKAVLLAYLGGEAGGGACADILFGKANPCGKLAETFPLALEDTPAYLHFAKDAKTAEYRESIFVGYRWYDAAKRAVAFPFGYGLSYTSFEYSKLELSADAFSQNDSMTARVTVKNTGDCAGAEVVQLYVEAPQNSAIYRAPQELKGFAKVFLQPQESKTVEISLDTRSFAYYNEAVHAWAVEGGVFTVAVGASSRDIRLKKPVTVQGDGKEKLLPDYKALAPIYYNLPENGVLDVDTAAFEAVLGRKVPPAHRLENEPFTLNSTLGEIASTPVGMQLMQSMSSQAAGMDESMQSMIAAMLHDMPLRSLSMMSGGALTNEQVEGIVKALNGEA